jgi:hypothetical protein
MADIPTLMAASKTLTASPKWVGQGDQFRFVSTFEVGGVTQEGIWLRGQCVRTIADRQLMFQIEFQRHSPKDRVPAARIDWRPAKPHTNKNIGPAPYRLLVIEGSMHHRFDLNWPLGIERMLAQNLPIAVPLEPDPVDYKALLKMVGKVFKVKGLDKLAPPEWEPRMFEQ